MGRLGTPVPDPTSRQNQCCTFTRHVSPPSLLRARALTREEAGPGNVRVRGGGGRGKQSVTRDVALNPCPRLAPACLFLKTQASCFFSQLLEPRGSSAVPSLLGVSLTGLKL